jgi:hypothetical protein
MASTRIYRTAGTPTLNTKHTISLWFKRSRVGFGDTFIMDGYQDANNRFKLAFDSSDRLELYNTHGGSYKYNVRTNRLFRDTAAFYHLVVRIDTTQASASDRVRVYVNGTEEESFNTYTDATQDDANNVVNESGATISIGDYQGGNNGFGGLMTHFHFVDGTSYGPDTFGETDTTSGIWKPKTVPSVTYGNNGFFLKFENSGNLDLDSSGNNLTFTTSGTLTQNVDTPSNVFATLNGINAGGGNTALSNGGLTYTRTDYNHNARSTLGFTKGKWYWEQKISDISVRIGLITSGFSNNLDTDSTDAYYGTYANGGVYLMNSASGTSWQTTNNDTSRSITTYTSAIGASAGDILMGAVDADAGKFWIGVNGTWMNSGDPAAGSNNQITFTNSTPDELQVYAGFGTSNSRTVNFNFGSGFFGTTAVTSANADANGLGAFEYTVPSGYYALCTKNIKEFG